MWINVYFFWKFEIKSEISLGNNLVLEVWVCYVSYLFGLRFIIIRKWVLIILINGFEKNFDLNKNLV